MVQIPEKHVYILFVNMFRIQPAGINSDIDSSMQSVVSTSDRYFGVDVASERQLAKVLGKSCSMLVMDEN
jgi:hypothetical protein